MCYYNKFWGCLIGANPRPDLSIFIHFTQGATMIAFVILLILGVRALIKGFGA